MPEAQIQLTKAESLSRGTNRHEIPRLDGFRVLVLFGGSELFGQERANIEVFRNLAELGLKARFVTSSKWGHKAIQPALDRLGFEWIFCKFDGYTVFKE